MKLALLAVWLKRKPNDNEGLSSDFVSMFTELCNIESERFRHGRVLLASRLISLFRVDHSWTTRHLIPLFDWNANPEEARAVWEGFLWSPRIYWPLLTALKNAFLDSACHYEKLRQHGRQFAALLTFASLDPMCTFSLKELQAAVESLPKPGLEEVAHALVQALEAAGDKREDYWRNRIGGFWHNLWPKSRERNSQIISETLASLCIEARGEFSSAFEVVRDWLEPLKSPHGVVHRLWERQLPTRFPESTLSLLHAVIDNPLWAPQDLRQCLEAIRQEWPTADQDPRYRRLDEYCRRNGM